jgi:hypothetical protein
MLKKDDSMDSGTVILLWKIGIGMRVGFGETKGWLASSLHFSARYSVTLVICENLRVAYLNLKHAIFL